MEGNINGVSKQAQRWSLSVGLFISVRYEPHGMKGCQQAVEVTWVEQSATEYIFMESVMTGWCEDYTWCARFPHELKSLF